MATSFTPAGSGSTVTEVQPTREKSKATSGSKTQVRTEAS